MNIRIYCLCYDDATESYIHLNYTPYIGKWLIPLRINESNHYLESNLFVDWIPNHYEEWKDCDYVGTLSWKFNTKIGIPPLHLLSSLINSIKQRIVDLNSNNKKDEEDKEENKLDSNFLPDMVSFHATSQNLVLQGARCHPHFKSLWIEILKHHGFSITDILSHDIKAFYYNYWMCKPQWMVKYTEFIMSIAHTMETLPDIQERLWSSANYGRGRLSIRRVMQVMNRPYFTHHCFILERLPCFFFHIQKKYHGLVYAHGIPEIILPFSHLFDWERYQQDHPDLGQHGIRTITAIFSHYLSTGWNEKRMLENYIISSSS